ncbi:Nucleoside-diphosphate-sugar epimerase [Oceanobacillus limi]|uniref:Nucleoside-diphosphate-sugar epimerase n=1 Tax=Oceanobacillus limi TaxID=930131 RepID=A0A1I0FJT0_9BACI|nr:NAD-dependent epimerase/dehydratase family protein [Oceanobacillus limi]SET57503.1 Nucleoside-diphosphate-sugar epimerase [Oceanobacillus limi]
MKSALVFGGTRFFGKDLVRSLLDRGVQVTIATRQSSEDSFGEEVDRLKVDRFDEGSIHSAVEGREWDVVFDQLCFSSKDAQIAVEALEGKVQRYVFTSTLSVYDNGEAMPEEYFNPYTYELKMVSKDEVSYQEGKRQAEAYFFQQSNLPVVAMRIPIVLGEEDYTERLWHYVNQIKEGNAVYFPNPKVEMCFIHQREAGDFLSWIAESDYTGPINACANGQISMEDLVSNIEEQTGREATITTEEKLTSPYGIEQTWSLSNEKATNLGYAFTELRAWLPELIRRLG